MNSRNIFLDLGSNMGMGFSELAPIYKIDNTWKVFAFEPNPHAYKAYLNNIASGRFDVLNNKDIQVFNVAVWDKDEKQMFRMESVSRLAYESDKNWGKFCDDINQGFRDGKNLDFIDFDLPATGGSCLDYFHRQMQRIGEQATNLLFSEPIEVTCIDFAKWITDNLNKDDNVVCKIDIEGSEYIVLPHLIETGAIQYIKEIIIEWHHWQFPKYANLSDNISNQLRNLGIKLSNWK